MLREHVSNSDFKGAEIGKYKKGKRVVVNIEGEWQVRELSASAAVEKGKLKLTLDKGQELFVDTPPRIVKFSKLDTLTDGQKGGDFVIHGAFAAQDGRLEYNLTTPDGKMYKGVPEEFLDVWSKTVAMEAEVEDLENNIQALGVKAQKDLHEKISKLKTALMGTFENLPKDFKAMTKSGKKDVASAVKKIKSLHAEAARHIDDLRLKIDEAKVNGAGKKSKIEHAETDADKQTRKAQEEGSAAFKTKKAKSVKDFMGKRLEQDKEEALADKKKSIRNEYEDRLTEWENQKRAMARPEPKQPNYKAIQLDAVEENTIRQDYDKRLEQLPEKILHENAMSINSSLENEFNSRRTQKLDEALDAKRKNTKDPKATLNKREMMVVEKDLRTTLIGEAVADFSELSAALEQKRKAMAAKEADPKAAGVDPKTGDYLATRQEEINARLYDVFIKERIKQYDIAKKDLEREEREEISKALENKKEEAYKKFLADSAEWDIEKSKLKKRPDEPVESSIVLTKDEEKQVAAKSKFESIKYLVDQNADLKFSLAKKRMEKAKTDPDKEHIVKLSNGNFDYDDDKKDEINAELFDEVLTEWEKAYEFKEKEYNVDAEVFDFTSEMNKINAVALDCEQSIPQTNGVPDKPYQGVYKELLKNKKDFASTLAALGSVDAAKKAGLIGMSDGQEELYKAREREVEKINKIIDELTQQIEKIKIIESFGEKFEQTEKMAPIDLRSSLVERILSLNIDQAKKAMKALYRGDATEEFKKLIGDVPPANISEIELRKAGIKDWADFKELWDTKLAKEVAASMEELAKQRILQKVAEAMDSLSGVWEKIKAIKGQMTLRAGLSALLVGGSAMTARTMLGSFSEILHSAAVMAGGAAGGAGKWLVGSKLFGKDSAWGKDSAKAIQKLQAKTADDLADSIVDEAFDFASLPVQPPSQKGFFRKMWSFISKPSEQEITKSQHKKHMLDGMPMMSSIIAGTIREVTGGSLEVETAEGKVTLSGANKIKFEKALGRLETQSPEEEQVKNLALVFAKMSQKGNELQAQMKNIGPGKASLGDMWLQNYSGRGSLGKSIAINSALAGVFLASSTARAAFGAAIGAYSGYKTGERMFAKKEQQVAKEKLLEKISHFTYGVQSFETLNPSAKSAFRADLIYLKKFLHGNAAQEDLLAAVQITEAGPVVDEMLLSQIKSLIHEAEDMGALMENKEDGMKLEKVLAAMQEYQGKISEKDKKKIGERFARWLAKGVYKFGGAAVGGAATAGIYLVGGPLIGKAVGKLRSKLGLGATHDLVGVESAKNASVEHVDGLESYPDNSGALEHADGLVSYPDGSGFAENIDSGVANFAAEHHLSEHSAQYLNQFSSLQTHPESLNRILEASHVGGNGHSHFTGSKLDNLIEVGGERRAVIFEELLKHDKQAAVKFLEDQDFSKQHLSHLTAFADKKGNVDFAKFVEKYNPNDKKMSLALFKAMQGKENTELTNAGFVRAATADHVGRTVQVKGGVEYFGLDKNGKPILSGDGQVMVRETLMQKSGGKVLSAAGANEGLSTDDRLWENANTIRSMDPNAAPFEGSTVNDYKINPVTDRGNPQTARELTQLLETDLEDKERFAKMGEEHIAALDRPIGRPGQEINTFDVTHLRDKEGTPIERRTFADQPVLDQSTESPVPDNAFKPLKNLQTSKGIAGKTVAVYAADKPVERGQVAGNRGVRSGSSSEEMVSRSEVVQTAEVNSSPLVEVGSETKPAAKIETTSNTLELTEAQRDYVERLNKLFDSLTEDEIVARMSSFNLQNGAEERILDAIANEPAFKNFGRYFESISNNRQPDMSRQSIQEFGDLLNAYARNDQSWYKMIKNDELRLMLDPNTDNLPMVANNSHAVRIWDQEKQEELFITNPQYTFVVKGNTLLKMDGDRVVDTWKNYSEAISTARQSSNMNR
jgi:hypothetical protein